MRIGYKVVMLLIISSLILNCNGGKKEDSVYSKVLVPENGFSNALFDKDGNLWLSSNGGGVYRFDGKIFKHYSRKDGLSSDQVFSIVSDNRNNLWFGTQKGLTKYDGNRLEHFPLPFQDTSGAWLDKVYPVINPNAVHSLALDNENKLWIGTAGGGAYSFDGENFQPFLRDIGRLQEDGQYHNWIPSIRNDKEGNLWFASMTHGGVNKYDGAHFNSYLIKDGLSDSQVRTIYCDRDGKIWVGFNGNRDSGLTLIDGRSFTSYSEKDGLCLRQIRAIHQDKNGDLWLGGGRGNLCIFDGKKFKEFNYMGEKYPDLLFIIDDQDGNIWFGGANGIWKFDGESVSVIASN